MDEPLPNSEDYSSFDVPLDCFDPIKSLESTTPESPEAPPFSPITPEHRKIANTSGLPVQYGSILPSVHAFTSASSPLSPPTQFPVLSPLVSPPLASSSPKEAMTQLTWSGFKVVIDNIDMNVRPRHQTFERQTKSIHYVNCYAVRDRVDLSSCGMAVNSEPNGVCVQSILPDEDDRRKIMNNFVVLAGRILYESIPAFLEVPNL